MNAEYQFRVTFRLSTVRVGLEPNRFETTMTIPAADPAVPGGSDPSSEVDADRVPSDPRDVEWPFFRDRLWRGEIGDEPSFREFADDLLGVEVVDIAFAELRTDGTYLDALRSAIAADLDRFNAESVDEVLHKYLGSSVHVRE